MKIDKIKQGMEVWTTVSGEKVRVVVLRVSETTKHGYGRRPDRTMRKVVVARIEPDGRTGLPLPKMRAASALHETRDFLAESPEDARERVAVRVKREADEVAKLEKGRAAISGELTPPPPIGKNREGKFPVYGETGHLVYEGLFVGPYFAIDNRGTKSKPDYYLTHTPTGLSVVHRPNKKALVQLARELETLPGIATGIAGDVIEAIGPERVKWLTGLDYAKPFSEWRAEREIESQKAALHDVARERATREYAGRRFIYTSGERYGQDYVISNVEASSPGSFKAVLVGQDVRGMKVPTDARTVYLNEIRFIDKGESADMPWVSVAVPGHETLIMRNGKVIWHIASWGNERSAYLWTTGPNGRPPGKPMIQPSNPQEFPALAGKSGTERAMAFAESGGTHTGAPAKARQSHDDTSVKPTTPIEFQRDAYEVQWANLKSGAIRGFGGEPAQALERAIDYAKRTSAERGRRAIEVFEADHRDRVVWRSGEEAPTEPRQGSFQDIKRSPEWVRRSRDKGFGAAAFGQIAAASAEREWEKSGSDLGFDAWKRARAAAERDARDMAAVMSTPTAKAKESKGLMAAVSAGAFKESVDYLNRIYGESARKSARILAEALKRSPGLRGNLDDRTYRLIELWSKPGELTPAERLFEQSNLLYRDAVKAVQERLPNARDLVRDAQDALNQAAVSGYSLRAIGPLSRELAKLEAALQLPKYETWMGAPETVSEQAVKPRAVAKPKRQSSAGRMAKYMTTPPFGSHAPAGELVEVEGVLVGKYLGVHAEKGYRKMQYSLTHIPTSLRAGLFTKKSMAMRVARTLDERVGERLASNNQDEVVKAIGQNLAHWMRSGDDGEYDAWKRRNGIVEPDEVGDVSCPLKALPSPKRSRDEAFGAASSAQIRRGMSGKTKKAFSDAGCRLVRHYLENACKK